jgi:non-specific serine/threonine protein kinase
MPEGGKKAPLKDAGGPPEGRESGFRRIIARLRKRRIIETLAAFIGGGWLLVEIVERLLVSHYQFPVETIDLTVVSVIGALLATLIWRWFGGTEKRPGNIKVELLLVPLIVLATLAIDLILLLKILEAESRTLIIVACAVCAGIAWIVLKSLQWAASPAAVPGSVQKPAESPSPAAAPPEKSIVVLPFTDLSPQKDQEYFCDGMTEEILTDLSHVHELLVISRSSAMTFKGSSKMVRDIAKDLNIRYVMEGSVRRAGNELRITAQLIDALNDAHLWAEKYSGTLDDVFDIQEKVSRAAVGALKMKLAIDEDRKITERSLTNIQAYDAYLRARQEIARWTEPSLDRALRHLESALKIVGDNSAILAGLALVYLTYATGAFRPLEETLEKAKSYATRALEKDPEMAPAHSVLGVIAYYSGDMRRAFALTKRAVSINPDDPDAVLWFVHAGISVGRCSACRPFVARILQTDPLNSLTHVASAVLEFYDGRFEASLEAGRAAYELDPQGIFSRGWYCMPLFWTGRFNAGRAILDKWSEDMPGHAWWAFASIILYGLQGRKAESRALITDEMKATVWNDTVGIWGLAAAEALSGEPDEAMKWLEHGLDIGCFNYPFLSQHDPYLAAIRGEPRFKRLIERVKHEWEHFEEDGDRARLAGRKGN